MKRLSVLVAALLLTGCAAAPVPVETIYMTPPTYLLQPCPAPFTGSTLADVMAYLPVVVAALAQCNGDKRALREWKSMIQEDGSAEQEAAH